MKHCHICGTPNADNAKFCASCGQPLITQSPLPPMQQPHNRRRTMWIIVGACAALVAIVIVVVGIMYFSKSEETLADLDAPRVEYDSAIVNGDLTSATDQPDAAVDTAVAVTPAEASIASVTARGEIDGYPYSVTGRWDGNHFSGKYKNEYNGVTMSCSGYEAEGVLELTLTSGKTKCSFILNDLGNGYYQGYFYPGEKVANLQF